MLYTYATYCCLHRLRLIQGHSPSLTSKSFCFHTLSISIEYGGFSVDSTQLCHAETMWPQEHYEVHPPIREGKFFQETQKSWISITWLTSMYATIRLTSTILIQTLMLNLFWNKSINYHEAAPVIVQVGVETVHFTHVHCQTRHKKSGSSIIFCRRHQQNWRHLFLLFPDCSPCTRCTWKSNDTSCSECRIAPREKPETQERLTNRSACNNSFLFFLQIASPTANICWWYESMFPSDYSIPLQMHVCWVAPNLDTNACIGLMQLLVFSSRKPYQ